MALTVTADVIVVGGGLHGCSAALHLARSGVSVVLLEKDHVARHASGVNAGGVRRLGRDPAEVPLSVHSHSLWRDIASLVDDDCGYRTSRYLKVATTAGELDDARRRVDILRQQGFDHEEVVDADQLRDWMPAASQSCVGALHVDGDGAALPFRTTLAFARRARALGVRIEEGCAVTEVLERHQRWQVKAAGQWFEAPKIVNAAGAWGGRMAALLGDHVPLAAHAPMLAITLPVAPFVEPVVGALGAALSLKQFDNGTVLIGGGVRGTAEPDTNRTRLDLHGAASFLRTARAVFPCLADATINRLWAGIEGYTPDNLPVIGEGRAPGVVHSFGYSAHGFQLGPAAGQVVSQLVLGESPVVDPGAFSPRRFTA